MISIIVETIDKINTISITVDKTEKLVYDFDHSRNGIADLPKAIFSDCAFKARHSSL
ncbi:hypothetical protein [Treponema socranskii]